ncbi:MAG: hypothetical protein H0V83_03960 [Rubrobacter sp.]|nr:hypothetical protein [Rubrobacter sp.]
MTIDGYTQPGASPNTLAVGDDAALRIVLERNVLGEGSPIKIENSSNSVIKGLVLSQTPADLTNVSIVGNSVGNRIQGNFIGTDASACLLTRRAPERRRRWTSASDASTMDRHGLLE